jgi:hypothetical protein
MYQDLSKYQALSKRRIFSLVSSGLSYSRSSKDILTEFESGTIRWKHNKLFIRPAAANGYHNHTLKKNKLPPQPPTRPLLPSLQQPLQPLPDESGAPPPVYVPADHPLDPLSQLMSPEVVRYLPTPPQLCQHHPPLRVRLEVVHELERDDTQTENIQFGARRRILGRDRRAVEGGADI